jgi:IclR family mhp operon transcriptional activator
VDIAVQPKPIRAFARGLAVLEALNRLGSATAMVLAREANVPRPTVYRLLRTLEDGGYVGRGSADDSFTLRLQVRRLSGGFADAQWIVEIAGPALQELTARISWPCDISTLEGLKMVIRDTTHRVAPLSIDRNMVGRKLPLLGTASGLAYLSAARAQEQAALLSLLASSADPHDAPAQDAAGVARLLSLTRRRGYASRQGGPIWPHTGAIALPIRLGERVLGCVSTIWMARVVDRREGVQTCLEPLQATRDLIERRLAEQMPTRST